MIGLARLSPSLTATGLGPHFFITTIHREVLCTTLVLGDHFSPFHFHLVTLPPSPLQSLNNHQEDKTGQFLGSIYHLTHLSLMTRSYE